MHRWDSIGYYGDLYAQTPKLDRLSTEGIRYDAARDPNPLCMARRSDPHTQSYIPAPPIQPEDLTDTQAMEKYRQEKEEYDEVVSKIRDKLQRPSRGIQKC